MSEQRMSNQKRTENNNTYISLKEAAEYSGYYSQEYLSLRARQGKLRATKQGGRNWLTKKEWVDEYIKQADDYKDNRHQVSVNKKSTVEKKKKNAEEAVKTMPTISSSAFQPVPRAQLFALVAALVFIFASIGSVFGYPYYAPPIKDFVSGVKTNLVEIGEGIFQGVLEVEEGISQGILKGEEGLEQGVKWVNPVRNAISNGVKGKGREFSQGISGFGVSVSAGVCFLRDFIVKEPKKISARISNGTSLIVEKIANKWMRSQQFVNDAFVNLERDFFAYGVGVGEGIKGFGALISAGLNDNLVSPVNELFTDIGKRFTYYITQDIQSLKNISQNASRFIFEEISRTAEEETTQEEIEEVPAEVPVDEEPVEEEEPVVAEEPVAEEELTEEPPAEEPVAEEESVVEEEPAVEEPATEPEPEPESEPESEPEPAE